MKIKLEYVLQEDTENVSSFYFGKRRRKLLTMQLTIV